MGWAWLISIVLAIVIADHKKSNVWLFLVLGVFTGPLAVILALVIPANKTTPQTSAVQADPREQLAQIKRSLDVLQGRVAVLERTLQVAVPEPQAPELEPVQSAEQPKLPVEKSWTLRKTDMELNFGQNWLNKIGIAVFVIGVGLLIGYAFKFFGPVVRISIGYAVAVGLFALGIHWEKKEKMMRFGQVLLGGAWALVYFTTYAMHHFEASRVIADQNLAALLLALVVVGMTGHVLRYRSETMMSVTLLVAYLTLTFGEVSSFTVSGCLLLSGLLLFLVHRFQWVRTFVLGVIMTYAVHVLWVMPHMGSGASKGMMDVSFLNFLFLMGYWAVFSVGVHIAHVGEEDRLKRMLAAANVGNTAFFIVLAYPLLMRLPGEHRFMIAAILGAGQLLLALLMKRLEKHRLYVGDVVAAVFFISCSLLFKFSSTTSLLLWLIEVPLLFFAGVAFREKVYRSLSYAMALMCVVRFFFLDIYGKATFWGGISVSWQDVVALAGAVTMGMAFYLSRQTRNETDRTAVDHFGDHLFSVLAAGYLTGWILSVFGSSWRGAVLAVEAVGLFLVSAFGGLRRFRAYAYAVLLMAGSIMIFEHVGVAQPWIKWTILGVQLSAFFAVYHILRVLLLRGVSRFFDGEEAVLLGGGLIVLLVVVFRYLPAPWITLGLGVAGLVFAGLGIWLKDRWERLGGLFLFACALGRLFFVDLAQVSVLFKIITMIVLGVILLAVSYGYTRFNIDQDKRA